MSNGFRVGGWLPEQENQAAILNRSLSYYSRWRASLLEYEWDPPTELDPRPFYTISQQGSVGSCQGNAVADAAEVCQLLANGEYVQLSRAWAYIGSQVQSGLDGRDSGSTLDGGSRLCQKIGIPTEKSFPYVANYRQMLSDYRSRFDELLPEANQFKMMGEAPLSSYEEIYHWLASLQGPVQIGILWGLPDSGTITSYRAGGGGHSVNFIGYVKVSAWDKPGLIIANSWGPGWGDGGFAVVKDTAVDAMCRHQWNVFVGRSDMDTPRPRPKPDL